MNKKNKKANNIGTAMHTVSYLGQPYIKSDYKKPLTLQEIVENQEKHMMLIPRSKEDQEYIDKLGSLVVNVSDIIKYRRYIEFLYRNRATFVEKNEKMPVKLNDRLNLLCGCHNCNTAFPLKDLKFIKKKKVNPALYDMHEYNYGNFATDIHWALVEGYTDIESNTIDPETLEFLKKEPKYDPNLYDDDSDSGYESEYEKLRPICAKFPICPSSWSEFDLRLMSEPYNLDDAKKRKYIF